MTKSRRHPAASRRHRPWNSYPRAVFALSWAPITPREKYHAEIFFLAADARGLADLCHLAGIGGVGAAAADGPDSRHHRGGRRTDAVDQVARGHRHEGAGHR